jgi:23S rRNA (guanosine2251-2'-O)-methyltransferase
MGQRKHPSRPRPTIATHPPARRPHHHTALWLYGRHAVLAAVGNPHRKLLQLLATGETAAALGAARETASEARPPVQTVDRRAIDAVLPAGATHQGFAALAQPLPPTDLNDLLATLHCAPNALLVVLDQVTDPRNVGAVLRSAEAFGAAATLVQDRHAPEESGALAKAASGALESLPLVRVVNLARALRALRDESFHCIGLAGDADVELSRMPLGGRVAIVLGAEGEGLRRLVRETCDALVRIPIAPGIDSLNLSAAAAIALYECARAARHGTVTR